MFQVPVLADNSITLSDYIGRLHWPAKVSIGYFLYALGIDSPIVKQRVSQKYGNLNYSIKREELHSSKLFQEIFDNEESEIRLNARDEKNSLVCYLKQENVIGKVAIVDIGWHGNMQYNLQTLLQNENIPNNIYGYYIGVKPNDNKKDNVKMLGYIFDDHKNLDVFAREENINSLFEQIFIANHGSTKRLKYQTDGQIVPELYSKEQINFEMTKLIMDYQTGALNFVMQMHKFDYYLQNLTSKYSVSSVLDQFLSPTYEIAETWGQLMFKDVGTDKLVVGKLGWKYIFHFKKFKHDYVMSIWKEGFLKSNFKQISSPHSLVSIIEKWRNCRKK